MKNLLLFAIVASLVCSFEARAQDPKPGATGTADTKTDTKPAKKKKAKKKAKKAMKDASKKADEPPK
jgi:hypothetical protein